MLAGPVENIKNISSTVLIKNRKINIFLDLCEIDDKNYHSGIRFTFYAKNVRGEIAKGGRYNVDNLDKKKVATGFTCYMDTILRASSAKIIQKKIMIPFDTPKLKIKELITKGYSLTKYIGNKKINKKLAKEQNCQFFLGNNSINKL